MGIRIARYRNFLRSIMDNFNRGQCRVWALPVILQSLALQTEQNLDHHLFPSRRPGPC